MKKQLGIIPTFFRRHFCARALVLTFALCIFSGVAYADIIKCSFTEPFVTITYSMAQQKLTVQAMDLPDQVYRNVSFQILAAGEFDIVNNKKPQSARLKLLVDPNGSDGMSEIKFPYTGKAKNLKLGGHQYEGELIGGCESNYLKKKIDGL